MTIEELKANAASWRAELDRQIAVEEAAQRVVDFAKAKLELIKQRKRVIVQGLANAHIALVNAKQPTEDDQ
jgi:hypothetical protein